MDPSSLSEHDSEKENLPPSPSSSQNPVPETSQSKKQVKRTTTTTKRKRKQRTRFTRRKRTRRPLADITHVSVESSSVGETANVDLATASVLVRETAVVDSPPVQETTVQIVGAPSSEPVQGTGIDLAPVQETGSGLAPSPAPARASRSRKRKAVDQNDSSPNTKSLRMGFR